jgi:hypothetical protein
MRHIEQLACQLVVLHLKPSSNLKFGKDVYGNVKFSNAEFLAKLCWKLVKKGTLLDKSFEMQF